MSRDLDTPSQEKVTQQLLNHIKTELKRDDIFVNKSFCWRFLKARKFDLEKAKTMVQGYFQFRNKMLPKMEIFKSKTGFFIFKLKQKISQFCPKSTNHIKNFLKIINFRNQKISF